MKYYKVPEDTLREFIYESMILAALENGGVDNWEWYGPSIKTFKEANANPGEGFWDMVERVMKEDYVNSEYD